MWTDRSQGRPAGSCPGRRSALAARGGSWNWQALLCVLREGRAVSCLGAVDRSRLSGRLSVRHPTGRGAMRRRTDRWSHALRRKRYRVSLTERPARVTGSVRKLPCGNLQDALLRAPSPLWPGPLPGLRQARQRVLPLISTGPEIPSCVTPIPVAKAPSVSFRGPLRQLHRRRVRYLRSRGQYFTNTSPVNGQPIAEFPHSTAEDIDKALDAAHAAADAWGRTRCRSARTSC
ncbi:aldehyde dehydrogenase family protein [Pseudomonas aeruginosa]